MEYKYDVAISFAEEDRHVASEIKLALEIKGFKKVYYYPNERAATWGKELEKELENIYSTKHDNGQCHKPNSKCCESKYP